MGGDALPYQFPYTGWIRFKGEQNFVIFDETMGAVFQLNSTFAWWTPVIARRSKTTLVSGKSRDSDCFKFHFIMDFDFFVSNICLLNLGCASDTVI